MLGVTDVVEVTDRLCLFNDGSRVTWPAHMNCNCLRANTQHAQKKCCEHIVYVIREQLDHMASDTYLQVPIILPEQSSTVMDDTNWLQMVNRNGFLMAVINPDETDLLVGPAAPCRLQARHAVIPHLLGLANQVTCEICNGAPLSIQVLRDPKLRLSVAHQLVAIREVLHWLHSGNAPVLCREHDNSDLVPPF